MPRVRASWIIVVATVAVLVAARPLREQVRGIRSSRALYRQLVATAMVRPGEEAVAPYQQQALAFVERHYPDDPDMLAAAGSLSTNRELGASRLWRATQRRRAPLFYAAHVHVLMSLGPHYIRLGRDVEDPTDAEEMARAQQHLREIMQPDRLDPRAVATVLEVLHAWEACDRDNALPHALEASYLYGMHRDDEARREWARAGQLPVVQDYRWQLAAAEARLLNRMGMPQSDAVLSSLQLMRSWPAGYLQAMARYACYEGGLAQQQGRVSEAMQWWHGTLGLGRHLQASSDTAAGFALGVSLEQIGAAPIWRLYRRGFPYGLLTLRTGGRLHHGPAHDDYSSRFGPKADAEMRDRLLTAFARTELLRGHAGPLHSTEPLVKAVLFQEVAGVVGGLAGWCLVIFLLASLAARGAADRAASAGLVWRALAVVLPPALALAAAIWALHFDSSGTGERTLAGWISRGGFLIALLAAVAVPLLRATCWRPPRTELGLIWRGNLRRALPAVIAVSLLIFLGLNVAAAKLRADWLQVWARPGVTEMSVFIGRLGPDWEHPALPQDAWRAERPPPAPRPHPGHSSRAGGGGGGVRFVRQGAVSRTSSRKP